MTIRSLAEVLERSAADHDHLCPRQVLGARMGLWAGELLGLDLPRRDKRILVVVETDGCAVDGVTAATGCSPGHRTLRIEDYGKVAATFIDTQNEAAIRVAPSPAARRLCRAWASEARSRWEAQLLGYQRMPAEALLSVQRVMLGRILSDIISRPGMVRRCAVCGEEIMNERWVMQHEATLCRSCMGDRYYESTGETLDHACLVALAHRP